MLTEKIKNASIFLLCTLAFWTVIPLILVVLLPMILFRFLIKLSAKLLHPNWVGILNGQDGLCYQNPYETTTLNSRISATFFLNGQLNLEEFIRSFHQFVFNRKDENNTLEYQKLTFYSELWCGFPFWKRDEQFKLENHIHFSEKFRDSKVSEEDVEIFLGDNSSTPLPSKRSPWDVILFKLKTKTTQDKFVVCFRFHHSLMDGLSLVKMVNLLDLRIVERKIIASTESKSKSNWKNKGLLGVKCMVYLGYIYMQKFLGFDKNAWKIPESQITGRLHMVSTENLDFEIVRKVGKVMGVGVTSVIHGAIVGGIQSFFRKEKLDLPNTMKCALILPDSQHPLEGLVNNWTYVFVDYPLYLLHKQRIVQSINEELKRFAKPDILSLLSFTQPIHGLFPAWLVNRFVELNTMHSIVVSNFPGPRNRRKFCEKYDTFKIAAFIPRMAGNCAISVFVIAYDGKISFSICADKGLMPDRAQAKKLGKLIQMELKTLCQPYEKD